MSNTIIRAPRRYRFVTINQDAVEDSRLSWAARGLLGYLLSRPDDWKVLIKDLQRRGDLGRDGIYKLLRELRETGYVQYSEHGMTRAGCVAGFTMSARYRRHIRNCRTRLRQIRLRRVR